MATVRPADLSRCPRQNYWPLQPRNPDGLYPGYHPGEFLAEEMEARGWTDCTVAVRCGLTELVVRHIRLGNIFITRDIAVALWIAFDIKAYMWLAMEAGRWKAGI